MTEKLTCPKCGSENIEEDYRSGNWYGENFKEFYCGHCKTCGADLQWEEVYKFVGYANIKEES